MFIQENPLENVVCEMASILSRPQCVNVWVRRSNLQRKYIHCSHQRWNFRYLCFFSA